ncbi:MAG: hypothetical protein A2Z32_03130 [Chloroflexi bacterium RBG_16_69_14]|nr:MAG: hypothetical protein A2Z32_03130 [Chloroflexi bacterium RBG_16_69_14]
MRASPPGDSRTRAIALPSLATSSNPPSTALIVSLNSSEIRVGGSTNVAPSTGSEATRVP